MAENPTSSVKILREGQYKVERGKYIVHAPKVFKKTKEQEIDESTNRIEELREEIRKLEQDLNKKIDQSETEADDILSKAEEEADRVVKQAEESAFERVQHSLKEKEDVIEQKKQEVQNIIKASEKEGAKKIQEAEDQVAQIKADAHKQGFAEGREEGFNDGKKEVAHMVDRLHTIINATIEEREKIMVHSEQQIINLVLTMVEKIVKKLTKEEHDVVVNNVKEAIALIHGATRVYIHVNPDDYTYTLEHKQALIDMIEGMPEVKFFENPAIDKGGVYIETDLGDVDATIASQLNDIEEQIRFYMPVKVKTNMRPLNTPRKSELETPVDSKAVEASEIVPEIKPEIKEEAPVIPPEEEAATSKVSGNPYWDGAQEAVIPKPEKTNTTSDSVNRENLATIAEQQNENPVLPETTNPPETKAKPSKASENTGISNDEAQAIFTGELPKSEEKVLEPEIVEEQSDGQI